MISTAGQTSKGQFPTGSRGRGVPIDDARRNGLPERCEHLRISSPQRRG